MPDPAAAPRLFFALRPPVPVRAALAALRPPRRGRLRPVHPEDLHLTLAFLGPVPESRHPLEAGARAAEAVPAFELALGSPGVWRRAGIAWVAPEPVPTPLLELQQRLAALLEAQGFPGEGRPFRPHVTLARGARRAPAAAGTVPVWPVRELSLMASGPPPAPRYRVLARWSLAAPGSPGGAVSPPGNVE